MTVDGKALGEIDVGAPASLVTLEPNVCHVLQEVAYGSGVETKPSIRFPAKSVVSVPEYPLYVLKFGPTSIQTRGKGTTITELVRSKCR